MEKAPWLLFTLSTIVCWSATGLFYKAGILKEREDHTYLKYAVSVGVVFFVIACVYLVIRDEPFSIWESAVRFWPMTIFGIVYAVINAVSFNGYVYNEVTVESPVEGIGAGTSTILLMIVYLMLGRVKSISSLFSPLRTIGILIVLVSIIMLSVARQREGNDGLKNQSAGKIGGFNWFGLGTLIFPVLFAMGDALETIVTGVCLDTTYGFGMPQGDSIIIVGMESALFALGCWIYIRIKEKRFYNPFKKQFAPRLLGSVADNVGIVFYSYAMSMDAVSTDPIIAVYPVLVMLGGRVLMKEKVSPTQYVCLFSIVAGNIMVIADKII